MLGDFMATVLVPSAFDEPAAELRFRCWVRRGGILPWYVRGRLCVTMWSSVGMLCGRWSKAIVGCVNSCWSINSGVDDNKGGSRAPYL